VDREIETEERSDYIIYPNKQANIAKYFLGAPYKFKENLKTNEVVIDNKMHILMYAIKRYRRWPSLIFEL
jgi:hypothetical protein